ncbi:MAG: hypothetical protein ACI3WS_04495, partial [Phascolarctobacterium sp.]
MLLRKLGKRGTAIIEYVILLSFVAVIGTSFTSEAGMGGSIKSIITNVEQLLGLAAGKEAEGRHPLKYDDSVSALAAKYLDVKTSVTYDYMSDVLKKHFGADELKGVTFNNLGQIKGLYYTKGDELLFLQNEGTDLYKYKPGLQSALDEAYSANGLNSSSADITFKGVLSDNYPDSVRQDFMYVAYDQHGNVTDKADISNLKITPEAASIEGRTTQFAING